MLQELLTRPTPLKMSQQDLGHKLRCALGLFLLTDVRIATIVKEEFDNGYPKRRTFKAPPMGHEDSNIP